MTPPQAHAATPVRLHPDASLYVEGADGIVESSDGPPLRLAGHGAALASVCALTTIPRRLGDLRSVLGAEHGDAAVGLVDALVDVGALIPWTLTDRLSELHRGTLGAEAPPSSVSSSDPRRLLRDSGGADVVELPKVPLPDAGLADVLGRRRSVRAFSGAAVPLEVFSSVLVTAAGCGRSAEREPPTSLVSGGPAGPRPYPSPGGLYPTEVIVYPLRVEGLSPAFYRYQPLGNRLARQAPALDEGHLLWLLNDHPLAGAAFFVLLWVDLSRMVLAKYEQKAYRLVLLEGGHLSQNLLLAAVAWHLGGLALTGFRDQELAAGAALEYPSEVVLEAVVVGDPADSAPAHVHG